MGKKEYSLYISREDQVPPRQTTINKTVNSVFVTTARKNKNKNKNRIGWTGLTVTPSFTDRILCFLLCCEFFFWA